MRIELLVFCPQAFSWMSAKKKKNAVCKRISRKGRIFIVQCSSNVLSMLNLFPFYRQCLAFAHEVHISLSVYYGAYFSNWTGFCRFLRAPISSRKFAQRKWNKKYALRLLLSSMEKNIVCDFVSVVSDTGLWYGMALCRLWFATCLIFTLSLFCIFYIYNLQLQLAGVYVFVELEMQYHGSRQQCHHSKLTKNLSHSLAHSSAHKKRKLAQSGVWVFHVKFFIGMSEQCTCFNDFRIFVWRLLNRSVWLSEIQLYKCTFSFAEQRKYLSRLMHIFTCQVCFSTCWIVIRCNSRILGGSDT